MHPRIERFIPWLRIRREAQDAIAAAEVTAVETATRKGRSDAVVRSIQQRVYAENHISMAVVAALTGKGHRP